MKISYATCLPLFLSLTIAAPAEVEKRAPSNAPINLLHGPEEGEIIECGGKDFDNSEIYLSAQRAVNLKLAGETRGRNKYPHPFDNDDSKGNKLNFPDYCPADTDRYEFPLKVPVYDGGPNNVKQGDERVVYYWDGKDRTYDGNPNVQFCGIMTHVGAPTGGFLLC